MRGRDDRNEGLFSYVRLEERVPADHPLRAIRSLADEALADQGVKNPSGRPSNVDSPIRSRLALIRHALMRHT